MKKIIKLLTVATLIVSCLLTMGCSSYGRLEKAFLDAGYTAVEQLDQVAETIKADLEKEDLVITAHGFTKKSGLTSDFVIIFEFKSTKDLAKACKESNTLAGFIDDLEQDEDLQDIYEELVEEGYAKGNCLVFSLNILNAKNVTNIVKGA